MMNVNCGDILNNNGLWISRDVILNNTDINPDYLRVAKSRAKRSPGGAWSHEKMLNNYYFSYTHLPGKYQSQLPDVSTLQSYASTPSREAANLVDNCIRNGYKSFKHLYVNYEPERLKLLARAASIIVEASQHVAVKGLSYRKSGFFSELASEIKIRGIKYLPKTWRELRDKIKKYADGSEITGIVFPKNESNTCAAKFSGNDAVTGWLVELAASERNYSSAFIYRKIRQMCRQHGMDRHPSLRWVSSRIAKPETQYLIAKRYGDGSRFNQNYRGYTPLQSALFAGDCWQIDGTRVNIIDHKSKNGRGFLYVIAVRDVMSGMPLGWEYCHEESARAVINAVANAVRNTGYLPYEFCYDRFPGHNTDEWAWVEEGMRRKGVLMTVTHRAEGKANVERWFETLQSVFMSESDLFYGEGVKSSRKYAHRSKEYVKAMRQWAAKNGFDFDDACLETDNIINNYSATPLSDYSRKFSDIKQSPFQLHEESEKPNAIPVGDHEYCHLFGLRKQVSIRNYMIQTQIDGAARYYGVDDCGLIEKYTGVKLLNCFDHEDLSRVYLYDNDAYLGCFEEITPAQRFGPGKEMGAVGKVKAIVKSNEDAIASKYAAIMAKKEAALREQEASDEVGLIQGGVVKKQVYEKAETAYLRRQWDADEEEIAVSARTQY